MKYRTRTYYTDAQKASMWERWKQGWTLHQIAQLFNRSHTSVQGILSRTGGFRPPARSRCAMMLTWAEREEISRAVVAGVSMRSEKVRCEQARLQHLKRWISTMSVTGRQKEGQSAIQRL